MILLGRIILSGVLSAVLLFLGRTYLFKLNQPKTTRDNLWSGTHTHTHTHHSQISWLATVREDTPEEPSGMCSWDSEGAVGKKCSALDWLLSDLGSGEIEG